MSNIIDFQLYKAKRELEYIIYLYQSGEITEEEFNSILGDLTFKPVNDN